MQRRSWLPTTAYWKKAESEYAQLTLGVPFTDVKGHWAIDAIRYVYEHGLMNGTSAAAFTPGGTLNRAMLATILYRMAGSPAVSGSSSYSDVTDGVWYSDAVRWAKEAGVVTGYEDGTFQPARDVTREQMAAMLYRYAAYQEIDTATGGMALREYSDYAEISGWALEALAWANAAGLITGRTAAEIVPGGTATRAEAAAVLMRFCEAYSS